MAFIRHRGKKHIVVDRYIDENGNPQQLWEPFEMLEEAEALCAQINLQKKKQEFVPPHKEQQTMRELLEDYVNLYGVNTWAPSTYEHHTAQIRNYVLPYIGEWDVHDATPKRLEVYLNGLLKERGACPNGVKRTSNVTPQSVHKIQKLLRSVFNQAVKWGQIDRNPAVGLTLPKYEKTVRAIWNAEQIMQAIDACDDEKMALLIQIAFACSLRLGEITGLQWDRLDISDAAIKTDNAYLHVDRELSRLQKSAMDRVGRQDIYFEFPALVVGAKTRMVLKKPKTASSVRTVWIPRTLAMFLREWKEAQAALKQDLGCDYFDYGLVLCQSNGRPIETRLVDKYMKELAERTGLPKVVFHSLRHSSTTYKLKLTHGDLKAAQGDTGHATSAMVMGVYAHILDEDRKVNAQKFDQFFYGKGAAAESADEVLPQPRIPEQAPGNEMSADALVAMLKSNPSLAETIAAALGGLIAG